MTRTHDLLITNCGNTVFPRVFKAFGPFSPQNQQVKRTACSTVSTPAFPVVGQDVGQENEHDVPQKNDTAGESGSSYLAVNKKLLNPLQQFTFIYYTQFPDDCKELCAKVSCKLD